MYAQHTDTIYTYVYIYMYMHVICVLLMYFRSLLGLAHADATSVLCRSRFRRFPRFVDLPAFLEEDDVRRFRFRFVETLNRAVLRG